jgi:sulfite reductase (NADPH) flavoprotein alpha-component
MGAMTDTHQFLRLTLKLKMNRLGAYRIAGDLFVRPLPVQAVDQMLNLVKADGLGPKLSIEPGLFVSLLKPLQHRAYFISSSPKAHIDEVYMTIAFVRWSNAGRSHNGVCSTFLADRCLAGDEAGIFVSPNKAFRVPIDDNAPVIMVGPGTGIAPFRAFLQERQARGALGKNWLFFGDQRRKNDFIYEDELSLMSKSGLLTRLDLAFSRDQAEKYTRRPE